MTKTVVEKFEQLKMKACAQNLDEVIKMAEEKNWPPLKEEVDYYNDKPDLY